MIHLLNNTLTHYPKLDFNEEGDVNYADTGTNVKCRWVPKDYTSDEVEGISKQLHGKATVMASSGIKSNDKVTIDSVDYIVWQKRAKVEGNGQQLFFILEVYRQDTRKS